MSSTLLILLLVIVLVVSICVAIILHKANKKLKKEIENVKNTASIILEEEKKYEKVKEGFTSGDDIDRVNATLDFLQYHKRGDKD